MSTYRYRQKAVQRPNHITYACMNYNSNSSKTHEPNPWFFLHGAPSGWGGCSRDYIGLEWMSDYYEISGQPRIFHPVNHQFCRCTRPLTSESSGTTCTSGHVARMETVNYACIGPSPTPDVNWSSLVEALSSQVRDRLPSGGQLFVSLGELASTVRMVTNPFSLLKPNWRQLAGKNTAAKLALRGANLWLEGRYGWNSLYRDVKSYCKSYHRWMSSSIRSDLGLDDHSNRFSVSEDFSLPGKGWFGSLINVGESPEDWPWYRAHPGQGFYTYGWNLYTIGEGNVHATVGCKAYRHVQTLDNRLSRALRYVNADAASILPTLWELLPYSFVVDWFVDVQGLLKNPSDERFLRANTRELGHSIKWAYPYMYLWSPSASCWDLSTLKCYPGAAAWQTAMAPGLGTVGGYIRSPNLPDVSLEDFFGTDLSFIQKADGLGLILQKILR